MFDEVIQREQTIGANEWQNLIRRDEKGDRVSDPEQTKDDETGQPIAFAIGKDPLPFLEFHGVERSTGSLSASRTDSSRGNLCVYPVSRRPHEAEVDIYRILVRKGPHILSSRAWRSAARDLSIAIRGLFIHQT